MEIKDKMFMVSLVNTDSGRKLNDVIMINVTDFNKDSVKYEFYNRKGVIKWATSTKLREETRPATVEEILASPFRDTYLELKKEAVFTKIQKSEPVMLETKVSRTKEIIINGVKRKVVVVVGVTPYKNVRAGYAVCMPGDDFKEELGITIASGRAIADRTNLTPGMIMGEGMNQKYILYAIADYQLKMIERGVVKLKGVK